MVFVHAAVATDRYGEAESVAVQSDGKIVVAGYASVGRASSIALVRYNVDGSLDKSFNGTGKVIGAVGDEGDGVALQNDAKIVVAGCSYKPGGEDRIDFAVLRYNPDGTLDSGFGDSGKVTTEIGRDSDHATSVALQSGGKIVVAGWTFAPGNYDFAVARYDRDGKLDLSFNGTGKATADFGKQDLAQSVAVQSNGKIVVAGDTKNETKQECALACFKANGSLDMSFNGTGKVTTNFGGDGNADGQGVTVQTDGKIVVAGNATVAGVQQFALARYNTDGTLDTSFGGTGRVLTPVGSNGSNATGVALQKDGKIVVAGYAVDSSGTSYDFACVRYNNDGSLDQGFGDHGKVTTDVGDGKPNSLTVQDGKIILAGSCYDGPEDSERAVVRYNPSGKLDMSFNSTGKVTTAIGSGSSEAEDTGPRASMAEINDPDGYANVRDYDGKVIARVKKGERFIAAKPWSHPDDPKWSVCLKSGIRGFMDRSRIHLLPDEPLMKFNYDASKKEWRKFQSQKGIEAGDTAMVAKKHGVDYYKTLVRASEGNLQALAHIFSLDDYMDGAAAEGYYPDMWQLVHVVGDKTLAKFVRGLPLADQLRVRGTLTTPQEEFANGADVDYLQRYFPETTKLVFPAEIVDWNSPDGRYAIRKTFTDPLDISDSKISHTELIEKATGHAVCDLTNADIGVDAAREGSVLWSPDSKRFACVASDLSATVYQSSGKSFTKIDLPVGHPPGKESDPEIKGAVVGEESVTPVRWANTNTLILERRDNYQKLTIPSGNHTLVRLYEITVSFKEDGTANTSWKKFTWNGEKFVEQK